MFSDLCSVAITFWDAASSLSNPLTQAIARKLQEKEEKLRRKHQQAVDREPSEAVFEGNGGNDSKYVLVT